MKTIHAQLTKQLRGEEKFSSADLYPKGKISKQKRGTNTSDYYSKVKLN